MPRQSWDFTLECHGGDERFYITVHEADWTMCESVYTRGLRTPGAVVPVVPVTVGWVMDMFLLWKTVPQEQYVLDTSDEYDVHWVSGMLMAQRKPGARASSSSSSKRK
jgi:hypothetical protein